VLTNNGIFENRSKWECKPFLKLEYGGCKEKFRNFKEVDDLRSIDADIIFLWCLIELILFLIIVEKRSSYRLVLSLEMLFNYFFSR